MKPFDFSFDDIKSFITPPTSWTLVPALALLCLARRLPCLLVCLPPCLDQIDVMDYDDIGGDELIGRTVIDLEDRWFDQRWQVLRLRHYDVFFSAAAAAERTLFVGYAFSRCQLLLFLLAQHPTARCLIVQRPL